MTLARAQGMSETAQANNVSHQQGLYRSLSAASDLRLSMVLAVIHALGFQLSVRGADEDRRADYHVAV